MSTEQESGPSGFSGDSFQETTSRSWFERIKQALTGMLIGLLLVAGGGVLLFWNEGRAVQTARSLTQGAGLVVNVANDRIDAANEGKLVHVSGPLKISGDPVDADLGVGGQGLRLVRKVEMYQWRQTSRSETRKKLGGGDETVTTYSYSREWLSDPQDSSRFREPSGHQNPPFPIQGRSFDARNVTLGAFQPRAEQIAGAGRSEALRVDPAISGAINQRLRLDRTARVLDGAVMVSASPTAPTVGDLRISYTLLKADAASVVAAQRGNGFADYRAPAGRDIFLVQNGAVPAQEMFADAQAGNVTLTWILRLVGLIVLFIGFAMVLRILSVLADVVPLFGDIVGYGTGAIAMVLALLLGATIIAIAWFFHRPLLSLAIFAGGAALAYLIARLRRPRPQPAPAV